MVYDEYLHSTVMRITEDAVNSAKQKAKETLQHNINEFALSMIDEHFDGNEVMKEYALRIIEDAEGTVGKRLTELCSYLGYDQSELLTNPVISGVSETTPTNKNEIVYVSDKFLMTVTIDGTTYTREDFTVGANNENFKFQKEVTHEGTHTVVAKDKFGNTTTVTFVIDKTAPEVVSVVKSNNDKSTNQDVTVTVTLNEKGVAIIGSRVCTPEGTKIAEEFAKIFAEFDAMMIPACSKAFYTEDDVKADKYISYKENFYTAPASITGLPAVVAHGVQLIGKAFSENALLELVSKL